MAAPLFVTRQYTSEQFVESCGAVLFDVPLLSQAEEHHPIKVCLLHNLVDDVWVLSKGRRNCHESRLAAAIRETKEETGFRAKLLPMTIATRAPSSRETADVADIARSYPNLTEPFMMTVRELNEGGQMKIIWWYIAVVNKRAASTSARGESWFDAAFFSEEEALGKLTYCTDRDVLNQAFFVLKRNM